MQLIQKLQELQGKRSQDEFAQELGITQGALSKIYRGQKTIGVHVARKIRARYPHLVFDLAAFLLTDDIPAEQDKIPA